MVPLVDLSNVRGWYRAEVGDHGINVQDPPNRDPFQSCALSRVNGYTKCFGDAIDTAYFYEQEDLAFDDCKFPLSNPKSLKDFNFEQSPKRQFGPEMRPIVYRRLNKT